MQVLNGPNGEPVEAIVVVRRINPIRIEVQVVTVGRGVKRRAPVVAVRAVVVETSPVPVASGGHPVGAVVSSLRLKGGICLYAKPSLIFTFSRVIADEGRTTYELAV